MDDFSLNPADFLPPAPPAPATADLAAGVALGSNAAPNLVDAVRALLEALDLDGTGLPAPVEVAWTELDRGLSGAEPWINEWLEAQTLELLSAIAAAPLGWESDAVRAARQEVERAFTGQPPVSLTIAPADGGATATLTLSPEFAAALPSGLLADLATTAPDQAAALGQQLAAITAERDGIHATWIETAAERDAVRAELAALTDSSKAEIAALNQALAASGQLNREAAAERDAARAERDAAQLAFDNAAADRTAAWLERDAAQAEAAELRAQLAGARGERDLAITAKAETQSLLITAQAEAERLRSQLAERLVELSAAQELRATLAEERDQGRAALAALEARAQRAAAEAQAAGRARDLNHADLARSQARERELTHDLVALRDEAADLRTRLAALDAQTATHRETLARAAELHRQLEAEKAAAETRANGAIAMTADLRARVSGLTEILRDVSFELAQLARALSREAGWWPGRRTKARLAATDHLRSRIAGLLPQQGATQ